MNVGAAPKSTIGREASNTKMSGLYKKPNMNPSAMNDNDMMSDFGGDNQSQRGTLRARMPSKVKRVGGGYAPPQK